jgi:predicted RNA methylase
VTYCTATYSPEDNKLRLYATRRLDTETYERIKKIGFRWAPRQDLFFAPAWSPDREDVLLDIAGEIGDEDKSLVQRAEERADRFEDYSDKRAAEADQAREAVAAIADNIPLGQPILVGHHSERHARRDAARIDSGMRRAVNLWKTSSYWKARAAGALMHARYKELPAVRARRIKTIEADKRRCERANAESERFLKAWTLCGAEQDPEKKMAMALRIANVCHLHLPRKEGDDPRFTDGPSAYAALSNSYPNLYVPRTVDDVVECAKRVYPPNIAYRQRWIEHYDNRLAYERAMLDEAGASDLLKPKPRRELVPLLNYRAAGAAITTENHWRRGEVITYPQVDMTKAEYTRINKDYRGTRLSADKQHRFRTAMIKHSLVCVFLTDSKACEQPAAGEPPTAPLELRPPRVRPPSPPREVDPREAEFAALAAAAKTGVKVVVAPQLFATPKALAAEAVELADVRPGERVLEPSAGTGALLDPLFNEEGTGYALGEYREGALVAVEVNVDLARALRTRFVAADVRTADFLELKPEDLGGPFDKIVMNPPFVNGADIKHVEHALTFLKPGGRLVAFCANGPRQRDRLMPKATEWRDLPEGSFAEKGTQVNAAMLVIEGDPR